MEKGKALAVSLVVLAVVFAGVSLIPVEDINGATGNFVRDYESLYGNSFKLKPLDKVFLPNNKVVTYIKYPRSRYGMAQTHVKSDPVALVSVAPNDRDDMHLLRPIELRLGKMTPRLGILMTVVDAYDEPEIVNDWAKLVFPYNKFDFMANFDTGESRIVDGHEVILDNLYYDRSLNRHNLIGNADVSVDGKRVRLHSFRKPVYVNGVKVGLNDITYDSARLYFEDVKRVDFS